MLNHSTQLECSAISVLGIDLTFIEDPTPKLINHNQLTAVCSLGSALFPNTGYALFHNFGSSPLGDSLILISAFCVGQRRVVKLIKRSSRMNWEINI